MSLQVTSIENATLETIYWWNRSEGYYHRYFSKFDEIYEDSKLLPFFIDKLFGPFLSDYSIRRNLGKGRVSLELFLKEVIEKDFFLKSSKETQK